MLYPLFRILVKTTQEENMKMVKLASIIVIVLGVVAFVIGGVFLGLGIQKSQLIVNRMNVENVTLALNPDRPDVYTQINDTASAQKAADTIASHRRSIAPTYQDLLGGKQFDPTNPTQLKYVQAMNLENYLYMAVVAFGLIDVTMAAGGFMIIAGIALILLALAVYRFASAYDREHMPTEYPSK
jgi:hypothetical protein